MAVATLQSNYKNKAVCQCATLHKGLLHTIAHCRWLHSKQGFTFTSDNIARATSLLRSLVDEGKLRMQRHSDLVWLGFIAPCRLVTIYLHNKLTNSCANYNKVVHNMLYFTLQSGYNCRTGEIITSSGHQALGEYMTWADVRLVSVDGKT